jgi:hypothetical protein
MNKSSNYRIRVEPELHQEFLDACKSKDKSAAQVIREFMRSYIESVHVIKQKNLSIAMPSNNYKRQGE